MRDETREADRGGTSDGNSPGDLEDEGLRKSAQRSKATCDIVLRVCVISVVLRLLFEPQGKPDSLAWTMLEIRAEGKGCERSRVAF